MIEFRDRISTLGMVSATKANALEDWREMIAAFRHYGRVGEQRVAAVVAAAELLEVCAIPFLLVLKSRGWMCYAFRIYLPGQEVEAAAKLVLGDNPAARFRRDHKRPWVRARLARLAA